MEKIFKSTYQTYPFKLLFIEALNTLWTSPGKRIIML
jgi:hypothetical protein